MRNLLLLILVLSSGCGAEKLEPDGPEFSVLDPAYDEVTGTFDDFYPSDRTRVTYTATYDANTGDMSTEKRMSSDANAMVRRSKVSEEVQAEIRQSLYEVAHGTTRSLYQDHGGAAATDGTKLSMTFVSEGGNKEVVVDTTDLSSLPDALHKLYDFFLGTKF